MKKYYKAYEDRYNTIHKKYNVAWAGDSPSHILKDFLEKNNISTSTQILEIGCGEGQNALYLMENGYNVFATDVSQEAINWCKIKATEKQLNKEAFDVMDILDNDLKSKFDVIISISTLHMLVKDEDRKCFFDFIHNHLTSNGIAFISTMGDGVEERQTDWRKAFEIANRKLGDKTIKVTQTSCRIVNWDSLLNEVKNSNLKLINNYVSNQISGFNTSMILELSK